MSNTELVEVLCRASVPLRDSWHVHRATHGILLPHVFMEEVLRRIGRCLGAGRVDSAAADAKEGESGGFPAGRGRAAVALGERAAKAADAREQARAMPALQQAAGGAGRELRLERASNQPAAAAAPTAAPTAATPAPTVPGAESKETAAPAALYFNPDLLTDAEGRAVIEFVMPSVEAQYRLLVDALGQGRLGSHEQLLSCGRTAAAAAPAK